MTYAQAMEQINEFYAECDAEMEVKEQELFMTDNSSINWLVSKATCILHPEDRTEGITELYFQGKVPSRMRQEVIDFLKANAMRHPGSTELIWIYQPIENISMVISFGKYKSTQNAVTFRYADYRNHPDFK